MAKPAQPSRILLLAGSYILEESLTYLYGGAHRFKLHNPPPTMSYLLAIAFRKAEPVKGLRAVYARNSEPRQGSGPVGS